MRTLFVGALAATVVGCGGSVPPRTSLGACAGSTANGLVCLDRSSVNQTIERDTASLNARLPTPRPRPNVAAATWSANAHQSDLAPAVAKVEPTAAKLERSFARRAENSDPVIARAKATIASRLDDPKSVEFGDMKRAMRTNQQGRPVDTICGVVKASKASGEGTPDRPFLYLVKYDEAYVVDGPPTSIAATAYRNICN